VPLPWVVMVAGISRIPLATPDNRLRLVASSLRASFRPLQVACTGIFTLLRRDRYPTIGRSGHINVWVGYAACSFTSCMTAELSGESTELNRAVDGLEVQAAEAWL
jgi:hypothetical protein